MVDFSTFDLIWHNVFAYGYIQVAVEQTQELRYNLQGKTRKLQQQKKKKTIFHFQKFCGIKILPKPHNIP